MALVEIKYYAGWLRVEEAAEYASVGKGQIREWMKDGLQYSQRGKTIVIKPEWIDQFLDRFKINLTDVDRIVDEVCNANK